MAWLVCGGRTWALELETVQLLALLLSFKSFSSYRLTALEYLSE